MPGASYGVNTVVSGLRSKAAWILLSIHLCDGCTAQFEQRTENLQSAAMQTMQCHCRSFVVRCGFGRPQTYTQKTVLSDTCVQALCSRCGKKGFAFWTSCKHSRFSCVLYAFVSQGELRQSLDKPISLQDLAVKGHSGHNNVAGASGPQRCSLQAQNNK